MCLAQRTVKVDPVISACRASIVTNLSLDENLTINPPVGYFNKALCQLDIWIFSRGKVDCITPTEQVHVFLRQHFLQFLL